MIIRYHGKIYMAILAITGAKLGMARIINKAFFKTWMCLVAMHGFAFLVCVVKIRCLSHLTPLIIALSA